MSRLKVAVMILAGVVYSLLRRLGVADDPPFTAPSRPNGQRPAPNPKTDCK